jgi:Domain of unknown function (DUF4249)
MKSLRLLVVLVLILDGCIEPFSIKLRTAQRLVVDGMITDQLGPYTVRIFRSLALDDQLDKTDWVRAAQVSILDDQGKQEQLTEVSPGNYQTRTFQGTIGKSYHIHFSTQDGFTYESDPELLLPVGDMYNLHSEFEEKVSPIGIDPGNPPNGFNILLDADVLPEQNGLVRWRWTGTFEIQAHPELRMQAIATKTGIVIIPDPEPCSGFEVVSGRRIEQFGTCTCCFCWVTQYDDVPLLSDKRFVVNNKITNYKIDFLQANRRFLYDKYKLEVEQMSLSQVAYDFWKKVAAQESQGSNLFQTPPPPTTGNMKALTEGAMPVSGIFSASAIKKQTLVVNRSEVPYALPPIDTIAMSCLKAYRYSTTVKPPFW